MDSQTMNKTEYSAKLVGILAGIIALVVFVIDIVGNDNARRADRTDLWRKAAIQKILHQAEGNRLDIEKLLMRIKSVAYDEDETDIKREDLTEDKIRVLLIEMISMGVLYQEKADVYELRFLTKTTSEADIKLSEVIEMGRKFDEFMAKLAANPSSYNLDSFYDQIVKDSGLSRLQYDVYMNLMIQQGVISFNEVGDMELKIIEKEKERYDQAINTLQQMNKILTDEEGQMIVKGFEVEDTGNVNTP